MKSKKENLIRKSNIELLRIVLMIMVIGVHYNLVGMGNAFLYTRELGINVSLAALLESLCIVCVDTFLIITGYFQINKAKINRRKISMLIVMIFFFNIIQYFLGILIFKNSFILKDFFLQMILGKWFIIIYLVLYIISPYINLFVKKLTNKEFKNLVVILISIFIIYQTLINFLSIFIPVTGWGVIVDKGVESGYNIVNFIVLYLIGGYIKKSNLEFKLNKSILGYLISVMLIFLSWYAIYHSKYIEYSNIAFYYNNIFVVLASVFIFLIFNKLNIKDNKVINSVASTVLGVFILSTSPTFIRLYELCYKIFNSTFLWY